jgi:hopene-associated glycosyltransferase HpnB
LSAARQSPILYQANAPYPAMALSSIILAGLAVVSFLIWLVLFFARGNFWRIWECDSDHELFASPAKWPSVTAVIPARNEAASIAEVVRALALQDYAGEFSATVVDDHSDDGTADLARLASIEAGAAEVTILSAPRLATGWTGKLWALNAGVVSAAASNPDYFWFTDADIIHAPDALRRLVSRAETGKLALTSWMVLLKTETFAERMLIPPFLYFFLMLYPPKWTANPIDRTAGAAGGSILLQRTALERIGGLSEIRSEIIDDCALARAVKRSGGKIWMGLTRSSSSSRSYKSFSQIRDMIARTAFTQLRYSTLLLLGTLIGLAVTFLPSVALTFSSNPYVWPFALAAWCLMTASFLPTVAYYRLQPIWAPLLPLSALFYAYATWLSAVRYWLGKGGQWKGRAQAKRTVSS